MKVLQLIKPSIWTHTAESFWNCIDSMYKRNENSKESVAVRGVSLSFGKKLVIRMAKNRNKTITDREIELLAMENVQEYAFLLEEFSRRKFKIINQLTQEIIYEYKPKSRAKSKRTTKGDAVQDSPAGRSSKSKSELLVTESN